MSRGINQILHLIKMFTAVMEALHPIDKCYLAFIKRSIFNFFIIYCSTSHLWRREEKQEKSFYLSFIFICLLFPILRLNVDWQSSTNQNKGACAKQIRLFLENQVS